MDPGKAPKTPKMPWIIFCYGSATFNTTLSINTVLNIYTSGFQYKIVVQQ